jgi:hypothetical protein
MNNERKYYIVRSSATQPFGIETTYNNSTFTHSICGGLNQRARQRGLADRYFVMYEPEVRFLGLV